MYQLSRISIIFLAIIIGGCRSNSYKSLTLNYIDLAFQKGNFTLLKHWEDSLKNTSTKDTVLSLKIGPLSELARRIQVDFSLSENQVNKSLEKVYGKTFMADKEIWEKNNWLEFKIINGEKKYFNRSLSNLKLILASRKEAPPGSTTTLKDSFSIFRLKHIQSVLSASSTGKPVNPIKIHINYQLKVNPDAVPDGEIVRCWLPYPYESHPRQQQVKLIRSDPDKYIIASDSIGQRSIYFEQKAVKDKPVIFELELTYVSSAQFFDLSKMKVLPYDTLSALFKNYTAEKSPHIAFTRNIKQITDSILVGTHTSVEKVRQLYFWINNHITWTGALEYSIMPFIPGYVLNNKRGDCGMQTLLFMTMARYAGIPVKWQSGWMMHPHEVNLHDWCEVYYEGIGWVPLDMSFNLQNSPIRLEKEFYMSGIDAYRMIVNDAISTQFYPQKHFIRSEPVDFQRGEVEWKGGNLYFNQWHYNMEVSYN